MKERFLHLLACPTCRSALRIASRDERDGETIVTTCIVTTAANALMAPIHERMPAILRPEQYEAWLDPANHDTGALETMIGPCGSEAMCVSPVSPAINRGDVEGPHCIETVAVRSSPFE